MIKVSLVSFIIKLCKRKNIILFLGPDGSGKTSITEEVCKAKPDEMIRVYLHAESLEHLNRPLVRLLFRLMGYQKRFNKRGLLGIFIRLICHFTRYVEMYSRILSIDNKILLKGYVCADRYAYDYFLRALDGNDRVLEKILYYNLFPKPKYVVLLSGSPRAIVKRKQELTEIEVFKTIEKYRNFVKYSGIPFVEIDTTENNQEQCKKIVLQNILWNTDRGIKQIKWKC